MQIFMAKKKVQDMREQLRQIITFTRGIHLLGKKFAYRGRHQKKRQAMIYAQQERRRKVLEIIAVILLILIIGGFAVGLIWLFLQTRGMI